MRRLASLIPFLFFFFGVSLSASAWSQSLGWPTSDCSAILSAGQPKPAWGTKEKITQEGLLLMINYQLAITACQQDEMLKTLRLQNNSKNTPESAKPKPSAPALANTVKPEILFPKPEPSNGKDVQALDPNKAEPQSKAAPLLHE